RDPASIDAPPVELSFLGQGISGMRIGYDPAWAFSRTDAEVQDAFSASLELLRALGATIVEVVLPDMEAGLEAAARIVLAEAAAVYEQQLRSRSELFDERVRERLSGGLDVDGIAYARARRVGAELRQFFAGLFTRVDL